MKKAVRATITYILIFLLTAGLMFALLVSSALIPDSAVRDNVMSSARFFTDTELFYERIEGAPSTKVDNFADCITLSIAWCFDENDPFVSTMKAMYYNDKMRNVNECLNEGLETGNAPDMEYIRYWHGQSALARIAHTFTDIVGMRIIAAVLIAGLTAALIVILCVKRYFTEAVCSVIALAAVSVWFVPDAIQNVSCFLVMPATALVCVLFALHKKYKHASAVLLISGVVTNFLDFLTTETLTLLFPLLLVLSIKRREGGKLRDDIIFTVKCCGLWLAGYGLMWVTKWICAAVILHTDVMPYVGEHITERLDERGDEGLISYLFATVMRNLGCLFPLGYGGIGVIAGVILFIALCFYVFVFRRNGADKGVVLLFLAVGAVVYIRYLVLHNHSYGHYFFTYRAQAASVLAVLLTSAEITGRRVKRGKKT